MSLFSEKIFISGPCPESVKEAFFNAEKHYARPVDLEVALENLHAPVHITFHDICDVKHLHSLWYGSLCATVSYDGWDFELGAYGEIRADLVYAITPPMTIASVVDKNNGGEFLKVMREHIIDDEMLLNCIAAEGNKVLEIHDGNWWGCSPTSPSGEVLDDCEWDLDCNMFQAIYDIICGMDEFISEQEGL